MRSLLSCSLLALVALVYGQDNRNLYPYNYFTNPPDLPGPQWSINYTVFWSNKNLTYGQAQSQPFRWVTNASQIEVSLQQEGNPNSVRATTLQWCSSADSFYWNGTIGNIDVSVGNVAYLAAWNCTSPGRVVGTPLFFSHYFNLTRAVVVTTTSSSSTATSIPTISGSTVTYPATGSVTGTATNTVPTPTSASAESGSSNTATLGAGIGGGIGGALLLIGAAGLFVWYRKKQKSKPKEHPNYVYSEAAHAVTPDPKYPPGPYPNQGPYGGQPGYGQQSYYGHAVEKDTPDQRLSEMGSDSYYSSHSPRPNAAVHQLP